MQNKFLTTLCAVLLVLGTAFAQDKTKGSAERMKPGSVPVADRTFLNNAAQGGMAEVQLGNLAKDHASNQAVKDFGQKMVDDHSKAGDELKNLASQKGVTVPTSIDAKDQAIYDRLSKLNGKAFDQAYIRDMVADHRKDIAEFQKEANNGKDPDLKQWAFTTLPTLQHHLKMAEDAQKQVSTGK